MATEDSARPGGDTANEPTAPIPATPVEPTQPVQSSPWARPAHAADANWASTSATTPIPSAPTGWSAQSEPTRPIPTGWSAQPEPTRQLPTVGTGVPTQPAAAPQTWGSAGQAYATEAGRAHQYQQSTAQGAPTTQQQTAQQPTTAQAPYGQQPYAQAGYPQQGYYQPGYYQQSGYQGYAGTGYPSGQTYSGPSGSQPPGYYPGQQYYAQPTPPPKKRWPVALVALLLVFSLGVVGYAATRNIVGTASSPEVTQVPQSQQTDEPQTWPSSETSEEPTSGGSTKSKSVTAAESKGVVLIEAETSAGTAAGTGMILSSDGKVLTNYHVVAGSTKLAVTVADSGDTYSATVVGFDQTRDVALIQLKDASGLDTVTTDDDQLGVGDAIAAVGNAEGGGKLVKASGKVTGLEQKLTVSSDSPWGSTEDLSGMIETTAGAVPGDSGGPMFDSENEVTGMTTAGSTKEGESYAVPIATALAVVDQIESGQDAGTVRVGPSGYLGIEVASSTYTGTGGATVTRVVADGPADKAGITAGSRITKVGETKITEDTNVANVIRALEPGSQVEITWQTPQGRTKSATVTLGSSPVN